IRDGDKLKIRISSINFAPYKADIILDSSEQGVKNDRILRRLAEILNKYRSYKIRVEGHAVSEYWNFPKRAEQEEKEELNPLSKARAEAVKEQLIRRGTEALRLSTVGLGGTIPIVPHGDLQNRWKNRRVEFILIKP
ncbi:MAG: OmpA family protein, partial [Spirochaetota bacterium]